MHKHEHDMKILLENRVLKYQNNNNNNNKFANEMFKADNKKKKEKKEYVYPLNKQTNKHKKQTRKANGRRKFSL